MGTFTKKMSVLSLCFPCEKILEIQNFLATRFVRLVLAGLITFMIQAFGPWGQCASGYLQVKIINTVL
jgi:hypothetical protein